MGEYGEKNAINKHLTSLLLKEENHTQKPLVIWLTGLSFKLQRRHCSGFKLRLLSTMEHHLKCQDSQNWLNILKSGLSRLMWGADPNTSVETIWLLCSSRACREVSSLPKTKPVNRTNPRVDCSWTDGPYEWDGCFWNSKTIEAAFIAQVLSINNWTGSLESSGKKMPVWILHMCIASKIKSFMKCSKGSKNQTFLSTCGYYLSSE